MLLLQRLIKIVAMNKTIVIAVMGLLLLSSCGTYEGAGAYTGAQFGSVIGSAIGGITGGYRGSNVGSLAGMVGGAVVGAAIGKAADNKAEQRYERYTSERNQRMERVQTRNDAYNEYDNAEDNSGFDPTGSGDDRITFDNSQQGYPTDNGDIIADGARMPAVPLQIRNARLFDQSGDGQLKRGEQAKVVFEIYNSTDQPVRNVLPAVTELTGNRHIHISENVLVESIVPYGVIRYTANVVADRGLRNGEVIIRIGVLQNNKEVLGQAKTFTLKTTKR